MTRLVCRSAPLPTKHIAEQMDFDAFHKDPRTPPEQEVCAWRLVVAHPKDTDNGQCWSEEIFSTL
jgi:hypothetical protein